jgi:hypothetical protein
MEQARAAPKLVMQEMHAYALGMADEAGALLDTLREKGQRDRGARRPEARAPGPAAHPPASNTGGKGHKSTTSTSSKPAGKRS